jgi:hypothetical protein
MIIHYDWIDDFEEAGLTEEEQKDLLLAAVMYARDKSEPEYDDRVLRLAWSRIRKRIDADTDRYAERVEKNRENAKKRWSDANASKNMQSHKNGCEAMPKDADTVSVYVYDTDIDTDPDNARAREAGPDREKVKDYFVKKGKPEEAEPFYNYYAAINWMIAGQPVKYWAKLADKWIANIRAPAKKAHNFTQRTDSYAAVEAKIFNK